MDISDFYVISKFVTCGVENYYSFYIVLTLKERIKYTEVEYRTAYLSLTRGDGGQNLIGKEQGPLLGII